MNRGALACNIIRVAGPIASPRVLNLSKFCAGSPRSPSLVVEHEECRSNESQETEGQIDVVGHKEEPPDHKQVLHQHVEHGNHSAGWAVARKGLRYELGCCDTAQHEHAHDE